ncbi:unnamed protein product, partial [marine sediment metagenome]
MKADNEVKAETKITQVIKRVTHYCKCDNSMPSFHGIIGSSKWIEWPIFNEQYRISYCPWCGKKLPHELG